MSDAAYEILTSKSDEVTGKYFMDDEVLISVGAMELSKYACVEGTRDDELLADGLC